MGAYNSILAVLQIFDQISSLLAGSHLLLELSQFLIYLIVQLDNGHVAVLGGYG